MKLDHSRDGSFLNGLRATVLTAVRRLRLSDVISATIIAATAIGLAASAEMRRPLTLDEFSTIERYTWAGVQPTGELRELRRIADFHQLEAPGLRHLAIGVYCAAGRWPEPGNHILNSLITNFALAFSRSEAAVRFAALSGAVVFAVLLHIFVSRHLGWSAAAPALIACVLWLPYMTQYATTARGYSWMLALQVLLLLSLHQLARQPASVFWGAVCGGAAILGFMNTVNLMVDWVFPVYAVLLLFPALHAAISARGTPTGVRDTWRRNILVQVLCIAAVGGVFVIDRLPYLYSSQLQYGLPTTTLDALWGNMNRITREWFGSGAGWILGMVGITGVVAFCARSKQRLLASICIATFVTSSVHFFIARTLPPARTAGFLLVLPIVGLAFVLQASFERAQSRAVRTVVASLCALAVASLIVGGVNRMSRSRAERSALLSDMRAFSSPGAVTYPFIPNDATILVKYAPAEWLDDVSRLPQDSPIEMCVFTDPGAYKGGIRLRGLRGTTSMRHAARAGFTSNLEETLQERVWYPASWEADRPGIRAQGHRLVRLVGRTESLAGAAANVPDRALVFWYPDPEKIGLGASDLLLHVDEHRLKYMLRSKGFQAKLDWFSRLELITLVGETRDECERILRVVETGTKQFGGDVVVFRPSTVRVQPDQ